MPKEAKEIPFALSKDFKPPEGVEFQINADDPLIPQAQQVMFDLSHGKLTPADAMSKFADLYASGQVASQQMLKTAREAEIGKLGANGPARVTAINTWLDAKGYAPLKGMLVTAEIVQTVEKLMRDAQGGASFSQQGREPANEPGKIAGIENMNFRQARAAQDAAKRH